jgi:hypothetical protein
VFILGACRARNPASIIGDYEDKDKVSDGQIVIFNGMLA